MESIEFNGVVWGTNLCKNAVHTYRPLFLSQVGVQGPLEAQAWKLKILVACPLSVVRPTPLPEGGEG